MILFDDGVVVELREEQDPNRVSACQICNNSKRARTFGTIEEARQYIRQCHLKMKIVEIRPREVMDVEEGAVRKADRVPLLWQSKTQPKEKHDILLNKLPSQGMPRAQKVEGHPCRRHNCAHPRVVVRGGSHTCVECNCQLSVSYGAFSLNV
jgi:hypothetical protein